jgi:hypothetical protein
MLRSIENSENTLTAFRAKDQSSSPVPHQSGRQYSAMLQFNLPAVKTPQHCMPLDWQYAWKGQRENYTGKPIQLGFNFKGGLGVC